MAKIKVAGEIASITMGIDATIVNRVAKYVPNAMKLTDEKGNDVFVLTLGKSDSFSKYGATFATVSQTTGKYSAAIRIPNGVGDAKTYCAEAYGAMISLLNDIEAQISDAAQDALDIEEKIASSIEVVE